MVIEPWTQGEISMEKWGIHQYLGMGGGSTIRLRYIMIYCDINADIERIGMNWVYGQRCGMVRLKIGDIPHNLWRLNSKDDQAVDELGYPFLRQEYYCDGISMNIHWNTNIVMKDDFHRSTPMGLYGERTTPHEDHITTNRRWWGKKMWEQGVIRFFFK
jgi:hypothetical protein